MSWTLYLDATDITEYCEKIVRVRRLSRPWACGFSARSDLLPFPYGQEGISRVRLYDGATLLFHGVTWFAQDDGEADGAPRTNVLCYDPMIYWPKKIARDEDGDFSKPTFLTDFITGPEIMHAIVTNSIMWEGDMGIDPDGNIETGGADLSGAPADWPSSLEDIRQLLVQTGQLDIYMEPTEVSTEMVTMHCLDGTLGNDLSADVAFGWKAGAHNVRKITRTVNMDSVATKIWELLGPKCDDQHWRGNVTRDDPYLPGNSLGGPGLGGEAGTTLGDLIDAARTDYGELFVVNIYDDFGGDCDDNLDLPGENAFRPLYQRIWQNESLIRARPRTLVKWFPKRGITANGLFDIGDLVSVEAGAELRGGFSGVQRVYEFTEVQNKERIVELADVVTSADQET